MLNDATQILLRPWLQEVAVLAKCRSENITEYYASVLKPGSSELFIVMELMAASVADLVSCSATYKKPLSLEIVMAGREWN